MKSAPNLVLVGPMGAGKSSIGKRLATRLGLAFFDADREVERRTGASITTIFECEGESGFRARESAALAELLERERVVIATGGGAVLRRENRRLLRDGGLVIFLDRSPWAIRRTLRRQGRPLLTDDGAIFRLARQRRDLYRAAAHHSVNKSTARQAAEEAVRLWREEQT